MERMNLFQDINKPQITFYFAECMEFPNYGEYKEFPTLAQAISLFEKCPGTLLNAVKCVGFILHDDSIYDDVKQPLMTSKHVLKDDINYISHYANTTLVQEAIKEAECYLRSKENSKPKITTGMFDNCNPLPAEMRENFKFTDEEIRYLSGVGDMFKNDKSVNFEIMEGPMPPAPIQDENRFICFRVEGKEYSLRIVSKEEMQRVKEEVNKNSKYTYDWFKEETGEKHWVFYNTEMYEINYDGHANRYHLNYRDRIRLAPVIPINATFCYRMFYKCTSLNKPDLNDFDTSQIINMYGMFESCENLIHLDLSNFDTSKVINMNGMFYHCKYLTQLDLSSFNTSNVTDMGSMFCLCQTLTKLDLSNFDTSNVTTMYFMFSHCYSLSQLDLSSFDTSKVFHMHYMFYACYKLTELDLSSFDTSSTYDIKLMFAWCKKLTTIYISDKWNIDSVKYSDDMFNVCRSLPGFSSEKKGIEMAKSIEEGGYLTLKKVA